MILITDGGTGVRFVDGFKRSYDKVAPCVSFCINSMIFAGTVAGRKHKRERERERDEIV